MVGTKIIVSSIRCLEKPVSSGYTVILDGIIAINLNKRRYSCYGTIPKAV